MSVLQRRSHIVADHYSFSVVLEPQEGGGYTVLVPALPEVVTEGETEPEALANAEEAIRAVLSYRQDHGIRIPADTVPEVRRVTVAAGKVGGGLPLVSGRRVVDD